MSALPFVSAPSCVTKRQSLEYVERIVEEADLVPFGEKQLERFSGKEA